MIDQLIPYGIRRNAKTDGGPTVPKTPTVVILVMAHQISMVGALFGLVEVYGSTPLKSRMTLMTWRTKRFNQKVMLSGARRIGTIVVIKTVIRLGYRRRHYYQVIILVMTVGVGDVVVNESQLGQGEVIEEVFHQYLSGLGDPFHLADTKQYLGRPKCLGLGVHWRGVTSKGCTRRRPGY
jgi:hypothetical protein